MILITLTIGCPGRLPAEAGVPSAPEAASVSEPRARRPLDINTADAHSLAEHLPGVGPVKAARIVAHRLQHGPFANVDDLVAVPGIGPITLERIRVFLTDDQAAKGRPGDAQPLSTTERERQTRAAVQALKALAIRDAEERGSGALDW